MKTVTRCFLRDLFRRRALSLLQFVGIACGVMAAVGIFLSARTSMASFSGAVSFLSGKTTHSLSRPAGPMSEEILVKLMSDKSVRSFAPVVDRRTHCVDGGIIRLMGIDPFLDKELRPGMAGVHGKPERGDEKEVLISFLTEIRAVFLDQQTADRLKIDPGDEIKTELGNFLVVGLFANPSAESVMLIDISHAQELFGIPGLIDRVDLELADEYRFRLVWENGYLIQSQMQRLKSLKGMLKSFRLNLDALSFLALFVGIFLIYNTAMFAVVTRRKEAGILRTLGAQRTEIARAFLTEILILGGGGGLVGSILGFWLSRFLTGMISETITRLYFFLQPFPPPFQLWIPLAGMALGVGAGLLGSFFPVRELVRQAPVLSLSGRSAERRSVSRVKRTAVWGIGLVLISFFILTALSFHIYIGFAGTFVFLVGASLLSGIAIVLCYRPIRFVLSSLIGLVGKVASGNIRFNLSRTAVAVAAFMVALSMSVGLTTMIHSFRRSMEVWMEGQINADLYISSLDEMKVPQDFFKEILSEEGIGGVDPYRITPVIQDDTTVFVSYVDAAVLNKYARFSWIEGSDESWENVKRGGVIVSESYFRRFDIGLGDMVKLDGIAGREEFPVAGVYMDYTTEHGIIMMDRSTYIRLYSDTTIDSLGIFIDKGNPKRAEILEAVRQKALNRGLSVFYQKDLHENVLKIFDSAFAVTRSMRGLAFIVAFFGIAGAILTLFIEKQRDFGIYRVLGFSTGQVAGITLLEGLIMAFISFLFSAAVGTVMSVILIRVINFHSFHWTVNYSPAWSGYFTALAISLLAGVGAAIYPSLKAKLTYPRIQLREE